MRTTIDNAYMAQAAVPVCSHNEPILLPHMSLGSEEVQAFCVDHRTSKVRLII
jgi:hypothetical protein